MRSGLIAGGTILKRGKGSVPSGHVGGWPGAIRSLEEEGKGQTSGMGQNMEGQGEDGVSGFAWVSLRWEFYVLALCACNLPALLHSWLCFIDASLYLLPDPAQFLKRSLLTVGLQ